MQEGGGSTLDPAGQGPDPSSRWVRALPGGVEGRRPRIFLSVKRNADWH